MIYHQISTECQSMTSRTFQMFFEACDNLPVTLCQWFRSDLKIFRMDIQNASTTPSKSNQLQNLNNV